MKVYTTAQASLMEELEAVLDRRKDRKDLSLVCVAGVTAGLALKCQLVLENGQEDRAASEIGFPPEEDDGEGWKEGEPQPG